MIDLRCGDCREVMAGLEASSVDAIVTDPPYGLEFMGKEWDAPWKAGFSEVSFRPGFAPPNFHSNRNPVCVACHKHKRGTDHCRCATPAFDETPATSARLFQQWSEAWAAEALRVLKPGAHLVAFGGTRTFHRLACALEDAGFEIRDCLMWLYGSGFPKSLDVSKAIDKAAGNDRPVVAVEMRSDKRGGNYHGAAEVRSHSIGGRTSAASPESAAWTGWGTALKPAWEPIVLARKPLAGTVAANVLGHGAGALNVDGCRIGTPENKRGAGTKAYAAGKLAGGMNGTGKLQAAPHDGLGRWPANVMLDEEAGALLDEQGGTLTSGLMHAGTEREGIGYRGNLGGRVTNDTHGDSGGASRFFYTAKAASGERHYAGKNTHPTVKPVDLMRWLCRLVCPPGGLIVDPFMGSGSTGIAALAEGFRFLGCDTSAEYVELARRRISGPLFAQAAEMAREAR